MRGKTIAVLGLTFKPNTDDMRDAPVDRRSSTALQDTGATVRAYDPEGMEQARPLLPDVDLLRRAPTNASKAPTRWCIVTEWDAVPRARPRPRQGAMAASPVIVDLRNIYRPEEMAERGFTYDSVGRPRNG